jgi:hypothetical protein
MNELMPNAPAALATTPVSIPARSYFIFQGPDGHITHCYTLMGPLAIKAFKVNLRLSGSQDMKRTEVDKLATMLE